LVALWREALLAQAVLLGQTKGYRNHPQLLRFRGQAEPAIAIAAYLRAVHTEAERRGYAFDATKIGPAGRAPRISVTRAQVLYEWDHLLTKLVRRMPDLHRRLVNTKRPRTHPLFQLVPGAIEAWEKVE
jgi:hypothetical protein